LTVVRVVERDVNLGIGGSAYPRRNGVEGYDIAALR
jgi:hypothetical protein